MGNTQLGARFEQTREKQYVLSLVCFACHYDLFRNGYKEISDYKKKRAALTKDEIDKEKTANDCHCFAMRGNEKRVEHVKATSQMAPLQLSGLLEVVRILHIITIFYTCLLDCLHKGPEWS